MGTYIMVFAGTGAIIVNNVYGSVSHLGIGLTFGLVVMAVIYSIGSISGAHINPAVSIAFWISKRFSGKEVLPYIISQFLGAILASLTLSFMFPQHELLGATLPAGSWEQSFVMEFILTFVLMFVILLMSEGSKEVGVMTGFAVGMVVAFEAIFAGPVSGASMNPARALAPALLSGMLSDLWLYWSAPFIGTMIAAFAFRGKFRTQRASNYE